MWQEDRHSHHLDASLVRVEELDEVVVSMAEDSIDTICEFGNRIAKIEGGDPWHEARSHISKDSDEDDDALPNRRGSTRTNTQEHRVHEGSEGISADCQI